MPGPENEQTDKWKSDFDRTEYRKILLAADTVEICSEHYFDGCMKLRNQRLVDLADLCVCYYSDKQRSGTGQTVRMAEQKRIFIINMYKTADEYCGGQ